MKIVADENIPFVQHYFGAHHELILKPGRDITRQDLLTSDILLVRSVTSVNQDLLKNTSIQFVGTTTTGTDHLDIAWLDQAGIRWAAAEGCNTTAVVEYVLCVIATLQKKGFLLKPPLRAGVIGAGRIGSQVAALLKKLQFEVMVCDPLRAETEVGFVSTPLEDMQDLDFVSLHTPLTTHATYPTYHLIEKNFLSQQKPGCFLLNTGRGSTIHFSDLKQYGRHLHWCLDVWENEPNIDKDILQSAFIATPHIAGYSLQSKYRGIKMIYETALKEKIIPDYSMTPLLLPRKTINLTNDPTDWRSAILQVYDPFNISLEMKNFPKFDDLRKNFPERYELEFVDFVYPNHIPAKINIPIH